MGTLDKKLYLASGVLLTILGLIFLEGSFIATVKLFGVVKAAFIRVLFTIPLSWLAIFLFANTETSAKVRGWFLKKQESLSHRAQMAVAGGKFFVVANTAIFLGPILASILMLMVGVQGKRIYFYAVLCALLCACVWSCFYGGVCWGFEKIFAFATRL
ncbi:MAG: hypothetical protein PHI58_05715 [Candidatus Omnitrophica bacterium]|nr:hypothetical protein [Candidatus Omnitrophota bacterium]